MGSATTPIPTPDRPLSERVRFTWDASDAGIQLQYMGAEDDLIACGAMEPAMMAKRQKGGPKLRFDSAGHRWHKEVRPNLKARSFDVLVVRLITDPKFAETLPCVPRGLRFPRLDWLDAHPGELHFSKENTHNRHFIAGTAEQLIAAGFPERPLKCKMAQRAFYEVSFGYGRSEDSEKLKLKGYEYARMGRLMRGYHELVLYPVGYLHGTTPPPETPTAAPRPQLRLVVDNGVRL